MDFTVFKMMVRRARRKYIVNAVLFDEFFSAAGLFVFYAKLSICI